MEYSDIPHPCGTEGPLRSILKDRLVDERMKLPLRFSKKKLSNWGELKTTFILQNLEKSGN
jgi:hypothetical protein